MSDSPEGNAAEVQTPEFTQEAYEAAVNEGFENEEASAEVVDISSATEDDVSNEDPGASLPSSSSADADDLPPSSSSSQGSNDDESEAKGNAPSDESEEETVTPDPQEKRIRQMESRYGNLLKNNQNLQSELAELKEKVSSVATPGQESGQEPDATVASNIKSIVESEEFKNLENTAPDTYDVLKELVNHVEQSLANVAKTVQVPEQDPRQAAVVNDYEARQARAAAAVEAKYPTWAETVLSDEWIGWIANADDSIQEDAASVDGSRWLNAFDKFYNRDKKSTTTQTNDVLEDAVPPNAVPSGNSPSLAGNDSDLEAYLAAVEEGFSEE